LGAPPALLAYHFVQGCVKLAGFKGFTGFDDFAALPPLGVELNKNILTGFTNNRDLRVKTRIAYFRLGFS
jgi:hypothetical protein